MGQILSSDLPKGFDGTRTTLGCFPTQVHALIAWQD